MKIRTLLLSILLMSMATLVMAQATDLFISEYLEGSSNNKAIEIFNGTGAPVNLSQYSVRLAPNGGSWSTTLTSTRTLANNDVFIIANAGANASILAVADTTSTVTYYNGNDAVGLFKNGQLIDTVGLQGTDPGAAGWDVAGTTGAMLNHTIVRKPEVFTPTTSWTASAGTDAGNSQWIVYEQDTVTYLGSHEFTGGTTDPLIMVTSPMGGEQWNVGTSHQITWTHANFTGNVKIELLNGTTPTTLVESTEDTGLWAWAIPSEIATGTNYKIRISGPGGTPTDLSDNPFSIIPAVAVIDVPDIATLRTQATDGTTVYRLTGEAWITLARTSRSQKYIQDNTAGILIDDPSGIITTPYVRNDGMTNLKGTLVLYHTQFEFIPVQDPGQPTSHNHIVQPIPVTLTELSTNFPAYSQQLVYISNVSFVESGVFATLINYNITDPSSGTMIFRANFSEADYIGAAIPTTPKNIAAIAIPYDAAMQISARNLADFDYVIANEDPIAQVSTPVLYNNVPNPFMGSTSIRFDAKSNNPVSIEVFNVKGQKVASVVNNERSNGLQSINWNGTDNNGNKLPSGVYLYKMQSGSYSSTKKMILMK